MCICVHGYLLILSLCCHQPPQVNAFVVPGGKVVVYTGALKWSWHAGPRPAACLVCCGSLNKASLRHLVSRNVSYAQPVFLSFPAGLLRLVSNEDELAAVLAHECAHVVAR